MGVVLLILAFIIMAIPEILHLLREKKYKELAVFVSFVFFSFAVSILQLLGIPLPNPTKGIEILVKQVIDIKFTFGG